MAYSMLPAELVGTAAGVFGGELTKKWGKSAMESMSGSDESVRSLGAALGATIGHYVGASVAKGIVNLAMGDVIGLAMNAMVTSPTTAAIHGMWAFFEKTGPSKAKEESK